MKEFTREEVEAIVNQIAASCLVAGICIGMAITYIFL